MSDTQDNLTPYQKDMLNRSVYHPPQDDETINAHQAIRENFLRMTTIIDSYVPEGREKSLAITKLEEWMFWCNAGIARDDVAEKLKTHTDECELPTLLKTHLFKPQTPTSEFCECGEKYDAPVRHFITKENKETVESQYHRSKIDPTMDVHCVVDNCTQMH